MTKALSILSKFKCVWNWSKSKWKPFSLEGWSNRRWSTPTLPPTSISASTSHGVHQSSTAAWACSEEASSGTRHHGSVIGPGPLASHSPPGHLVVGSDLIATALENLYVPVVWEAGVVEQRRGSRRSSGLHRLSAYQYLQKGDIHTLEEFKESCPDSSFTLKRRFNIAGLHCD